MDETDLITAERRPDALVVSLHVERLDSGTAATVQAAIEAAATAADNTAVVIDLGEVDLISSAGLGVLVHLHTRLRRSNRPFGVCGARGEAATVLRLARLDRLFDVCPSVGDFLLRLRSNRDI
jgi:anti-anti-sigma factor